MVLAVEPIRTTLGYGQVNTILMALVVADLLPDAPGDAAGGSRRAPDRFGCSDQADPGTVRLFALLIGKTRVAITGRLIGFAVFTAHRRDLAVRETLVFLEGWPGATPVPPRRCTPATSRCLGCSSGSVARRAQLDVGGTCAFRESWHCWAPRGCSLVA